MYWLEKVVAKEDEDDDEEAQCEASVATLETHKYQIYAKMADLYRSGNFGLRRDPMKAGQFRDDRAVQWVLIRIGRAVCRRSVQRSRRRGNGGYERETGQ